MSDHGTEVISTEMSLTAWADLPEDEPGELVDGRLEEDEKPTTIHEAVVSWLISAFGSWVLPRGGIVLGSEAKLALRPTRGRKPDLSVYLPGDPTPPGRASLLRTPPSIVVEVISPRPRDARRDRLEKADDYAAFGVKWYWLVDPDLRSLEVLELQPDGNYARVLGAGAGMIPKVPGCAELTLDLDALWALVDRLDQDEAP